MGSHTTVYTGRPGKLAFKWISHLMQMRSVWLGFLEVHSCCCFMESYWVSLQSISSVTSSVQSKVLCVPSPFFDWNLELVFCFVFLLTLRSLHCAYGGLHCKFCHGGEHQQVCDSAAESQRWPKYLQQVRINIYSRCVCVRAFLYLVGDQMSLPG